MPEITLKALVDSPLYNKSEPIHQENMVDDWLLDYHQENKNDPEYSANDVIKRAFDAGLIKNSVVQSQQGFFNKDVTLPFGLGTGSASDLIGDPTSIPRATIGQAASFLGSGLKFAGDVAKQLVTKDLEEGNIVKTAAEMTSFAGERVKEFSRSKGFEMAAEDAGIIGNVIASMSALVSGGAAATIVGSAGPVILGASAPIVAGAGLLSSLLAGTSVFAEPIVEQAREEGFEEKEALARGLIGGGVISALNRVVPGAIMGKVGQGIKSKIVSLVMISGVEGATEASERVIAELVKSTSSEDFISRVKKLEGLQKDFALGVLGGSLMSGAGGAISTVQDVRQNLREGQNLEKTKFVRELQEGEQQQENASFIALTPQELTTEQTTALTKLSKQLPPDAEAAIVIPSDENLQEIQKNIKEHLNVDIHFYDTKLDDSLLNGVELDGDNIAINVQSDRIWEDVIGHELTHSLRKTSPDLFQEVAEMALTRPEIKKIMTDENAKREKDGFAALSPEEFIDSQQEEVIADWVGDAMFDKSTWEAIQGISPSKVSKLARKISTAISRIRRDIPKKSHDFETLSKIADVFERFKSVKAPSTKSVLEGADIEGGKRSTLENVAKALDQQVKSEEKVFDEKAASGTIEVNSLEEAKSKGFTEEFFKGTMKDAVNVDGVMTNSAIVKNSDGSITVLKKPKVKKVSAVDKASSESKAITDFAKKQGKGVKIDLNRDLNLFEDQRAVREDSTKGFSFSPEMDRLFDHAKDAERDAGYLDPQSLERVEADAEVLVQQAGSLDKAVDKILVKDRKTLENAEVIILKQYGTENIFAAYGDTGSDIAMKISISAGVLKRDASNKGRSLRLYGMLNTKKNRNRNIVEGALLTPTDKAMKDLKSDNSKKRKQAEKKVSDDMISIKEQLRLQDIYLDQMTTADFENMPAWKIAKIVNTASAQKAGAFDRVYEYWLSSVLSTPSTFFTNILGYGNYAYEQYVKNGLKAVLNETGDKFDRMFNKYKLRPNNSRIDYEDVITWYQYKKFILPNVKNDIVAAFKGTAGVLKVIPYAGIDTIFNTKLLENHLRTLYTSNAVLGNKMASIWLDSFASEYNPVDTDIRGTLAVGAKEVDVKSGSKIKAIKLLPGKLGDKIATIPGDVIRIPLTMLSATDQAMKGMIVNNLLAQKALQNGLKRNLSGKVLDDFVILETLIPNSESSLEVYFPENQSAEDALIEADIMTFTGGPQSAVGQGVLKAIRGIGEFMPMAKFVTAFSSIAITLGEAGLVKTTPFGAMGALLNSVRKGDRKQINDHLADVIVSTAAWSTALLFLNTFGDDADDDTWITGSTPLKPSERNFAQATRTPKTVSIKGVTFDYSKIEPFATGIPLAIDFWEEAKKIERGQSIGDSAANYLETFASVFADKLFLKQLGDFIKIISAGQGTGNGLTKMGLNVANGFAPGFIRNSQESLDNIYRDRTPKGLLFEQQIPDIFINLVDEKVFSLFNEPPTKTDMFGNNLEKSDPGMTLASDFLFKFVSPVKNPKVWQGRTQRQMDIYKMLFRWNNKAIIPPAVLNEDGFWTVGQNQSWYPPAPQGRISDGDTEISLDRQWRNKYWQAMGLKVADRIEKEIPFNFENPTKRDIQRYQSILTKAQKSAKREILLEMKSFNRK